MFSSVQITVLEFFSPQISYLWIIKWICTMISCLPVGWVTGKASGL